MQRTINRTLSMLLAFMLAFSLIAVARTENASAATVVPKKVTGLKATKYSSTKVKLTWKKTANAKKYEIEYGYYGDNGEVWEHEAYTTKTTYTTTQAQAWECYYRVTAIRGYSSGPCSKVVSYKLPVTRYSKTIVPNFGTMYCCSATKGTPRITSQGYKYYCYDKESKLGFTEDYMEYLVNTGWTLDESSETSTSSTFTKDSTSINVSINETKLKSGKTYRWLMVLIKNNITAN